MIEYKLLDIGKGIIPERESRQFIKEVELSFGIRDEKATAIFGFADGTSAYKTLEKGRCRLSLEGREGSVSVCVAVLNGDAEPRKWECEAIKITRTKIDTYIVAPDDQDIRQCFIDLCIENENIRTKMRELEEKYDKLSGRLDALMEGYDLI